MFHTPNIDKAALQAEAMHIPLIEQETSGVKEEELEDMKKAFEKAKREYGIQGIVVGALFSDYQQERVNRICDHLDLKTFAPMWHKEQTMLLCRMVDEGFHFILQKVAAYGLDKSWLNVSFDHAMIDRLVALQKKIGINTAGEGGEYETLVLDGPCFRKKLVIDKASIHESEGGVAQLVIEKIHLEEK